MSPCADFDVMILGAGPAGSVLAHQLARRGYRVALLDRQKFPRYAIGETLPASVGLLLKRAGIVASDFCVVGMPTSGNLSAWGGQRVTFHSHTKDKAGRGFQVERSIFDSQLLEAARSSGAEVFEGTRPEDLQHTTVGWHVPLRASDSSIRLLRARFLCDATGRARVVARRLRLPQQTAPGSQIGLIGYWQGGQPRRNGDGFNALVESMPDGWCYTAQLDNHQRVAGFMTDRSLLPPHLSRNGPQVYLDALEQATHTWGRLRTFSWDGQLRIFPTSPSLVDPSCGPDWLLTGDAASTLDPLCSQGVQKAIASALTAATIVHTLLVHSERGDRVIEFCRERERSGFLSHLTARANYYRSEKRFARRPFWKQRRGLEKLPKSYKQSTRGSRPLNHDDHIATSPHVEIQQRPVIEGEFVEIRPVVIAPELVRGLRYCGDLLVPDLIDMVSDRPRLGVLFSRYQSLHRGTSHASFFTGLARLVEMGVLAAD